MSEERWDVVVVGGGHNGLICATYLAAAGLSTLLLEQRDTVGGAIATSASHPGLACRRWPTPSVASPPQWRVS